MRYSLFLLCLFLPLLAQAQDKTLEEQVPRELKHSRYPNFITAVYENDMIGGGTDAHYTSGVRLTYFDLGAKFPQICHNIAELVPTFDINETSSAYYSLGQNLYTPDDIQSAVPDPKDRPWAAFLYGSIGMASLNHNYIDELEATIGVVGPAALGEQTQRSVHKYITGSPLPQGWDNQLKNEPGLILSWQRRWPEKWQTDIAGLTLKAAPYLGASVGNVYTYANTGISVRLGDGRNRWSDTPLRVRPAMPGTGFFESAENGWDWSVFAGVEGRAVARNIFLDGNTFRDSPSVNKFPLVGDVNAGFALTFGRAQMSYTMVYRSKEFVDQNKGDLFGAVSLGYRF